MRNNLTVLATSVLLASGVSIQASAQLAPHGDAGRSQAFAGVPLTDTFLANIYGAGLRADFGRNTSPILDEYAVGTLQQVSQTSRVAMDNWWAQTGAALIDENLIASRTVR